VINRELKMINIKSQIKEIVNRETKAWDTQDIDLLMSIFHPDMVWPWPKTPQSHNPIDWVLDIGRYNYNRWRKAWEDLFNTHKLIHNKRKIIKIVISKEGDGAFAVVDIDTLWRNSNDKENHWKGRVCKVYTKLNKDWKLIMHTGVLQY
jgi:ketosteroid isomerase-like protein